MNQHAGFAAKYITICTKASTSLILWSCKMFIPLPNFTFLQHGDIMDNMNRMLLSEKNTFSYLFFFFGSKKFEKCGMKAVCSPFESLLSKPPLWPFFCVTLVKFSGGHFLTCIIKFCNRFSWRFMSWLCWCNISKIFFHLYWIFYFFFNQKLF